MNHKTAATWAARACFAAVFVINVACAVQFIADPGGFAAAYQLSGISGEAAVRGIGVTFLMWNATYPAFIWKPQQYKVLGAVILVQQLIGCVGESLILLSLPASGYDVLAGSIVRFIAFDVAGLMLMLASFVVLRRVAK